MNEKKKLTSLRKILGHESFQKGHETIFFCPKHPHHKPKLSVNLKTDWFHCWFCGFKGKNLKPLLFLKGKTEDAMAYANSNDELPKSSEEEKIYDIPSLPEEFISLTNGITDPYSRDAMKYLSSRGITFQDVIKYKLGFCKDGDYKFRIIMPSFDYEGSLNFFVGRKFYDHVGLSYKHGNFNKDIIFNDYLVDWDKPITLVEGPFDAIIAGDNAIPLQGTIINENLFAKIVTSNVPVYLAFDSDAKEKQYNMAEKFKAYDVDTFCIDVEKFEASDVAELGKEKFQLAKENAWKVDSVLGTLKQRIYA